MSPVEGNEVIGCGNASATTVPQRCDVRRKTTSDPPAGL
jgi:hypothetical protein